jgi:hypothetical protein
MISNSKKFKTSDKEFADYESGYVERQLKRRAKNKKKKN